MEFRPAHVKISFLFFAITNLAWSQRVIVPEDVYALRSASDPRPSPDGSLVAYVVTQSDAKHKGWHSEIWLTPASGEHPSRQLTSDWQSSNSPRWSPDGHSIAFLSARGAIQEPEKAAAAPPKAEVYVLPLDGGEAHQLTSLPNGVSSFSWSPDGKRIVCVSASGPSDEADLSDRSNTRHYVHPSYKYDGQGFFGDRRQHLWVVDTASGNSKQITDGDEWDDTDPQWSPDGALVAFYSDRSGAYWEDMVNSTADVWTIPADGGKLIKVADHATKASAPQWSPDGNWIAYFGIDRRLGPRKVLLAPASGNARPKELANDLDLSAHDLMWAEHGHALYFLSNVRGEVHVFRLDPRSGKVSKITSGARFVRAMAINDASSQLAYTASDFEHPPELYISYLDGSHERQLGHANDSFLTSLKLQPVERLSYRVGDGFDIDGFLIKPSGWVPTKKYPLILYIHGGPQGMFGTNWMLPVQIFAAHGWSVLFLNPRGSTGYGTKFVDAAVKEWGAQVYQDLMKGVDSVLARNQWIDADRLGVTGCSFGGFMTNWIISQTSRFKAAVPMCSISNLVSDEGTRDEYYGHAPEFGGDLYENFDLYWKYSPIRYAMNVKTPTLILHGESDQRVPLEQAEQWFRALHHFHVPAELVIFPDESHNFYFTGEPKHICEAMRWQVYWFERYLNGNLTVMSPDTPRKRKPAAEPVLER
jgi:dipeptidyl aminopeptidase/acylaminoacyl peptidase